MRQVKAMVHSLRDFDTVTILSENGPNNVVAAYKGVKCTVIYNVFNGLLCGRYLWSYQRCCMQ